MYFLKENFEVFDNFKILKALVKKQIGLMLKTLCSDQSGEYVSNEFEEFLKENGIRHQLHTPQQNGTVERKNRTIMDLVRNMLLHPSSKSPWSRVIPDVRVLP